MLEALEVIDFRRDVLKRSFASRSEAGRYAANMRWAAQGAGRGYIEGIGRVTRDKQGNWVDEKGTMLAPSVTRDWRIRQAREQAMRGERPTLDPTEVIDRISRGEQVTIPAKGLETVLRAMVFRTDHPDITNITLEGTGLMSRDNLGIKRKDMPQIPNNKKEQFLDLMEQRGVSVSREEVKPSELKPIQAEISGTTSGQIMMRIVTSREPEDFQTFDGGAIIISKDGYVIDGHHRWAANVALETGGDGSRRMRVIRVGLPHDKLIEVAKKWGESEGVRSIGLGENNAGDPDMSKVALLKMIDLAVADL